MICTFRLTVFDVRPEQSLFKWGEGSKSVLPSSAVCFYVFVSVSVGFLYSSQNVPHPYDTAQETLLEHVISLVLYFLFIVEKL